MRILALAAVAALIGTPALANDAVGVWKSAVNEEGDFIHVEIAPCASDAAKLCGTIVDAGNVVPANSDPERRAELLGKVMINDMVPDGANEWSDGTIWAPDDEETYSSTMELNGDVLEVSGCVLSGLICRGQDWTRLP